MAEPNENIILAVEAAGTGPALTARQTLGIKNAVKKKEKGRGYRINTTPYYSTIIFAAEVSTDVLPVGGPVQICFATFNPQAVTAFNYRIGDEIGDAVTQIKKKATRADTNLNTAYETVSDEDVAFEAIHLRAKDARTVYLGAFPGLTDPDVLAALKGDKVLIDPASAIVPPQIQSPFNLQNNIDQALRDKTSVNLLWGGKTKVPLGTTDYMHDATAKSYLRAAGVPAGGNLFKMPEGHVWEGEGADSQLQVEFVLEEAVTIALSAVTLPGEAQVRLPKFLLCEFKVSLCGVAFRPLGRNG